MKSVTKDDLIRDLRIVVDDLEALIHASANSVNEKAVSARGRAELLVKSVKARLGEVEKNVAVKAAAAAEEIDTYVREHAWETVAAAAKAGVFLGMLLQERKHRALDKRHD